MSLFSSTTLFRSPFLFIPPSSTVIYSLSLHDALPISRSRCSSMICNGSMQQRSSCSSRSEEHTSELQSRGHLVCRLLLEKKKKKKTHRNTDVWKLHY